jgi:hypothetical protein
MADKQNTDRDVKKADGNDALRGGTEGGAPPHVAVGGPTGGTNSISPVGQVQSDRDTSGGGTRTGSREDAEDLFEGSRKPSESEAKQHGRDEADAPTAARSPHGAGEPRYHQIHGDR